MKFNKKELKELEEIIQLLGNRKTFMLGVNLIKSKKYIESYEIIKTIETEDGYVYLVECMINSKFSESENIYFINTVRDIRTKLDISFALGGLIVSDKKFFRMAR